MALSLLPCSSSSSVLSSKHKPQFPASAKRFVSHFGFPCLVPTPLEPSFSLLRKARLWAVAEGINGEESLDTQNDDVFGEEEERQKKLATPCEVYVCNLPRSCDAAHLLDMFKPHGTILSVEVCRNAETGESKGCGYVTMGFINSAKRAIAALDGLDVGGREMRVRFSVEMNLGRRDAEKMNSFPKRVIYYEGPHKLYVGNLARAVKPGQLRNLFSRFGNVVSARVMHDHKQGKSRVYAFLSFQSKAERDAAMSLNGTAKSASTSLQCYFICFCLLLSLVFLTGILWSHTNALFGIRKKVKGKKVKGKKVKRREKE